MGMLKIGVLICLLLIIGSGGYYFYNNVLEGKIENLIIPNYNEEKIKESLINVSFEVEQFYPNMRFNHNRISYFINPECPNEKFMKMEQAFEILTSKTNGIIIFYKAKELEADILVGCSPNSYQKEENIFIGGEGGPTKIINSSIPVILKGKVLLYNETRSQCQKPILEIHELLHVFGYDHINNTNYIMYPYLDCEQEMNPKLINHLIELYSIEPFAEIYFEKVDAYREKYLGKWYLNFNVSVNNQGIIDAEETVIKVFENKEYVESFDLGVINFGSGRKLYVNDVKLSSTDGDLKLEISTNTKEKNIENNVLNLKTK